MSQQTIRTQRKIAEIQTLMAIIQQAQATRLCAVCRMVPTYEIRPGVYSLTCARMQCKRAWILREPWRCETCKSLDFERVGIGTGDERVKLYHCKTCCKTYAIRGRVRIETMADVENEGEVEE